MRTIFLQSALLLVALQLPGQNNVVNFPHAEPSLNNGWELVPERGARYTRPEGPTVTPPFLNSIRGTRYCSLKVEPARIRGQLSAHATNTDITGEFHDLDWQTYGFRFSQNNEGGFVNPQASGRTEVNGQIRSSYWRSGNQECAGMVAVEQEATLVIGQGTVTAKDGQGCAVASKDTVWGVSISAVVIGVAIPVRIPLTFLGEATRNLGDSSPPLGPLAVTEVSLKFRSEAEAEVSAEGDSIYLPVPGTSPPSSSARATANCIAKAGLNLSAEQNGKVFEQSIVFVHDHKGKGAN